MGLNNTAIDNDKTKYKCIIKIPKYCPYKLGKYILDFNRIYGFKCDNYKINPRKKILKSSKSPFINKNTFHIGFPLTNKYEDILKNIHLDYFLRYIYSNYIDMNN